MNARTAGDFDYDATAAATPSSAAPTRALPPGARGARRRAHHPQRRRRRRLLRTRRSRRHRRRALGVDALATPAHLAPAIDATAEDLPFADASFDAAMAMVTVHQWADTDQGLRELRRVSRGPVVILTFDGDALDLLWLADYVPELIAAERRRYPAIPHIRDVLGGTSTVTPSRFRPTASTASPRRSTRGPNDSWTRRCGSPSRPGVSSRRPPPCGPSARLRADLDSGAWDRRTGPSALSPNSPARSGSSPPAPADQSLGGHTGIWPRPDGNRMFFRADELVQRLHGVLAAEAAAFHAPER